MIVLDASAAVAALLRDGSAREDAAREPLHATYVALAEALGCALLTTAMPDWRAQPEPPARSPS